MKQRNMVEMKTGSVMKKSRLNAKKLRLTHGPSVSSCNLANGIALTTSKFSSVFILHPFTPT